MSPRQSSARESITPCSDWILRGLRHHHRRSRSSDTLVAFGSLAVLKVEKCRHPLRSYATSEAIVPFVLANLFSQGTFDPRVIFTVTPLSFLHHTSCSNHSEVKHASICSEDSLSKGMSQVQRITSNLLTNHLKHHLIATSGLSWI